MLLLQPLEDAENAKKSKSQEQVIRMALERFTVPEILFHPSDVGIPQMGLAEAIVHSIMQCPEGIYYPYGKIYRFES